MLAGVTFDVDGVLVDSPHELAWRQTLERLMANEWRDARAASSYAPDRFTTAVYQAQVAGKPRLDGARAALDFFHVPDAPTRAATYADRKQRALVGLIEAGEFTAYPDALRFVAAVQALGFRLAVASSSKNANAFLRAVQLGGRPLLDAFDVNLCGREFAHGKPDPEIFVTAGVELGLEPSQILVVEDAPAGVQAAKRAHMPAIGVARHADADGLRREGAELVVPTLDAVDVAALAKGRLERQDASSRG